MAERPTPEQAASLGTYFREGRTIYPVDPGREYVALGIGTWDGIVWAEIATDGEVVVSVPLFLFEIVDARPSGTWRVRIGEDGGLTLWPEAFYDVYFHDQLSNRDPSALAVFRALRDRLAAEAER